MQGRLTTAMMQASTWTTTTATFHQGATTLAATMTKRANILWNNQIVLKYINILVNEWTSDKQWWKELKKREEWGMREDADQWGMKWQKKRGTEWRRIPQIVFLPTANPPTLCGHNPDEGVVIIKATLTFHQSQFFPSNTLSLPEGKLTFSPHKLRAHVVVMVCK